MTSDEQSGLAYAINRAYHAWIRTQPQLILDLWDEGELDKAQTSALRLIEPASQSGSLRSSIPAAAPFPGGGLKPTSTAPDRTTIPGMRDRGQEVTL